MLEIKDIVKYYNHGSVNEIGIFKDFSLSVERGAFVSVIGSNGSGKTSLLNLVCGAILPDSGKIFVNGEDVTKKPMFKRYRSIGRVFQDPAAGTCPSMTLFENLSMAENKNSKWDLTGCRRNESREKYREMLADFDMGLENKLDEKVGSFSGGQRQAAALLMATMTPVELLILDEHTAALDPKTADRIMEWTGRIIEEKKLTAFMVTHNLRYALEYGNRLLMMHEGKVLLDAEGAEKRAISVDDLLARFYQISIEVGN